MKSNKWVPFGMVLAGFLFVFYKLILLSTFWNDATQVRQWMGVFLGLNLHEMASWQRTAARVMDTLLWSLLLQGWWHGAKAAWFWHQNGGLHEVVIERFNLCVAHICAAWALTLLIRPVRNLLLQWHLPVDQWIFKWQYSIHDGMTLMVCLCLIMMGMLCKQWRRIDQENKEFI